MIVIIIKNIKSALIATGKYLIIPGLKEKDANGVKNRGMYHNRGWE
jgi:hypothetical protein